MEIRTVGVIGAGVMGVGVAQNLAQTGHQAILVDISDEVLDRAREEIRKNLRFQGMFQKGVKTEPADTVLGRIQLTQNLEDLSAVDFVVENVPEKWEIKIKGARPAKRRMPVGELHVGGFKGTSWASGARLPASPHGTLPQQGSSQLPGGALSPPKV